MMQIIWRNNCNLCDAERPKNEKIPSNRNEIWIRAIWYFYLFCVQNHPRSISISLPHHPVSLWPALRFNFIGLIPQPFDFNQQNHFHVNFDYVNASPMSHSDSMLCVAHAIVSQSHISRLWCLLAFALENREQINKRIKSRFLPPARSYVCSHSSHAYSSINTYCYYCKCTVSAVLYSARVHFYMAM